MGLYDERVRQAQDGVVRMMGELSLGGSFTLEDLAKQVAVLNQEWEGLYANQVRRVQERDGLILRLLDELAEMRKPLV